METLFGFLILVLFIVVGVIRKVQEQKQLEERRRAGESRPKPQDLPEETRRMLYGTPDVPTARRARVRGAQAPQEEGWFAPAQTVTPPRPQPTAEPRQARPLVLGPLGRMTAAPPVREVREQPRRPAPPPLVTAQRPPRRRETSVRGPIQPARRPQKVAKVAQPGPRPAPAQARRPRVPQEPRPPAPRRREPRPVAVRALFTGLEDIRKGVILREILGPPVSFR